MQVSTRRQGLTSSGCGPALGLLLRLVGRANPVFFLRACPPTGACGPDSALRREILGHLYPVDGATLWADPDSASRAFKDATVADAYINARSRVVAPTHVFPIHERTLDAGFVVPFEVTANPRWDVSEAFQAFRSDAKDPTPLGGLIGLLRKVEAAWQEQYGGTLPARWLRPQTVRLLCPIHIEILSGSESAQVPLLVAILRALGRSADNSLPFGDQPVFATGVVNLDTGAFESVLNVSEKLTAFVRELGAGHPALLTDAQVTEARQLCPDALAQVDVFKVESVADLLHTAPIQDGLLALAQSFHPSMNDRLLEAAASLGRDIKFVDAAGIERWVLDRSGSEGYRSPYYASRAATDLALNSCHHGLFADARRYLAVATSSWRERPDLFGTDDVAYLAAAACTLAIDARMPKVFTDLASHLPLAEVERLTARRRIEYYGSLCQFHRFYGPLSAAIEAGRQAVSLVDTTWASGAGRSRNYLVHALIVVAREATGGTRGEALDEAERLLNESIGPWAPADSVPARQSHLGFCLHLEAEIARLRGRPFGPAEAMPRGLWDHPSLFTLLASARNDANSQAVRARCWNVLVAESAGWALGERQHSLFGLLHGVYLVGHAVWFREDPSVACQAIRGWLSARAVDGFPGWLDHIGRLLPEDMGEEAADRLFDAIRYH